MRILRMPLLATTLSFNADAADGPAKHDESRGYVMDAPSNAGWGQQYVWPIRVDYRISWLSPDSTETVITREKRDDVWIMARTPTIPAEDLARLEQFVQSQGYAAEKLPLVPQDAAAAAR
jgi:apolipoprotein D and lipocalin family protein